MESNIRSEMLLGKESIEILKNSKVAIFGVGGVGGYVAEALARMGVGHIALIDNDKVSVSNINRQIIALHSTVGRYKTEVMKERILDINPNAKVETFNMFYLPENADSIDLKNYDYIADAIDTVSAKIELAVRADKLGVPIISAMGTGNKLDPTKLEVTDIHKTSGCPLARVMRKEMRDHDVKKLKVVYSKEEPVKPKFMAEKPATPGSVAYVPSVAGLMMAGEIVRGLIGV
jgi:tRNA A37 threonylcarbamoyladenosine dehydratase